MTYEDLDRRIVNALLDDGRSSLRSLAERLDVSVTTVSNHLSELEAADIVEGHTPDVNYAGLGYDVTAVFRLTVDGSALPGITDRLRDHHNIVSVYEVTGDHDVVAIGTFEDTDRMNERIKAVLTDPDVRESNTSIVLDTVKESEQFHLDV
ncbi:MAG: HTH-type transcriptional regulator Lrp [Haloarculaceae archaeon]